MVLRIVVRKTPAAAVVAVLITSVTGFWAPGNAIALGSANLIWNGLEMFVLLRFGLVALAFAELFMGLTNQFPLSLESTAWNSTAGYAVLILLGITVITALRLSLGGRPLLDSFDACE
jgi:hypothetical protein